MVSGSRCYRGGLGLPVLLVGLGARTAGVHGVDGTPLTLSGEVCGSLDHADDVSEEVLAPPLDVSD